MKKTDENQSETIGFIAHEIKTPITALSGFLDLIQNVGELNTLQQNYLTRAFETLDWMQNIIDNIRQWSNLNHTVSIHPSTIELYPLFDGCINLLQPLASRRNIEITLTIRDNLRQIQADEELLKHVIINLLSNAIKYNVQDGTIDISISHNITHILFAIKDSGIGIAEQDQQKVFEQFYRASSGKRIEGTGLGLTISRKIIEAHGGKIWLESKLSEGTTSYFTLPIIQAYAHDSERAFYQAGEVIDDVHDDMQERQEISIEREGDEH